MTTKILFLVLLTSFTLSQADAHCKEFINPKEKIQGCKTCEKAYFPNSNKFCTSCPKDCIKCDKANACQECKSGSRYDNKINECVGGKGFGNNMIVLVIILVVCIIVLVAIFKLMKVGKEVDPNDGNELEVQLDNSNNVTDKDREPGSPTGKKPTHVEISKGNKYKDVEQVNSKAYKDKMEEEEYPEFKVFSGGFDAGYDKNNTKTGL